MSTSLEKNSLEYLMAAYYNEDYFVEYGGIWETLDAFLEDEPGEAPAIPGLIGDVLASYRSDGDLDRYLDDAGCDYDTHLYPGGPRAWLTDISERVENWLRATGYRR